MNVVLTPLVVSCCVRAACRTRLFFRQEKFNILREETEGYAKLLSVLSTLPAPPVDPTTQIKLVFSVIGQFDLDPNRVLDLGNTFADTHIEVLTDLLLYHRF